MPKPGARFAISSPPIRAVINPKAMQPNRAYWQACWSMPDARRERPQERAALSLLPLCRAGHRDRNGSRARLGRHAPSSGNGVCAQAVTLGATNGSSQAGLQLAGVATLIGFIWATLIRPPLPKKRGI